MTRRIGTAVASIVLLMSACGGDRVIAGAGTSIVDSSFMNRLAAEFSGDVSIVGGSTAEILELADKGAVSVAIVHDEIQEMLYLSEHPNTARVTVFASDYLVVGPPDLVAAMTASTEVAAFEEIVANGWTFVTRDDNSGTHARELAIWERAGARPAPDFYIATGQGMGFTLQVTDQSNAFTLVEAGAYLAARDTLSLVPVPLPAGEDLLNPYSVMLIDESGRPFFEWLTGPEGAVAVIAANNELFGEIVYKPVER